jgi:2-dehydropantoate 2-reductase
MNIANKARVLLIGSGSVGTIAAHALEAGRKAAVSIVCRSNYDVVKREGFSIDSIEHGRDITNFRPTEILKTIPDVRTENLQPYDYLVVTTKNIPDLPPPSIHDLVAPAVTPSVTSILLLQNGLNIEKPFQNAFPRNPILSGVSLIGSRQLSPGKVLHTGRDKAFVGVFPSSSPQPKPPIQKSELQARRFVDLYNASGRVRWEYDADVLSTRWRKLVYNASFNSIAAILQMDTGRMRMSHFIIKDLIRPAMLEIMAIARAAGAVLEEDVHEMFIRIDDADKAYLPSMGQDVMRGNLIELETIVGEPVREAERLGVPAPTLRVLYSLLRGIQLKTKEAKGLWEAKFDDDNPYR